jgi:glycosyltransferase involved in cell wall biosynthesis
MKVLMYVVGQGGLWDIAWQLSRQYAERGVDVTVQTTHSNPGADERPSNLYLLDNLLTIVTGKWYLKYKPLWAIDRLLRININVFKRCLALIRHRPTVLHTQDVIPIVDWFWLGLLPRRTPLVCTVHDVLPHRYITPFQQLENRLQGMVLRSAERLIVHTDTNKKELIDYFGIDAERISVIPHGITQPAEVDLSVPARRALDVPQDSRVLLLLGTLRENKGLKVLLEALPAIVDRHPDVILLVAGSLPVHHTFDQYDQLIEELALRKNVYSHIGWIEQEKLSVYYEAADLVILPYTKFHSQSGILLRAYPHKKPVVVTDVGGLGETVRKDQTGLVAPPNDSQALAKAINTLLEDEECYRGCQEAMAHCLEHYSWPSIAERTIRVYEACVSGD